jgi:hypothetical protein
MGMKGNRLEVAEVFFPLVPPPGSLAFNEAPASAFVSRFSFPIKRALSSRGKDMNVPFEVLLLEGASSAPGPIGIPRLTSGVFISDSHGDEGTRRAKD